MNERMGQTSANGRGQIATGATQNGRAIVARLTTIGVLVAMSACSSGTKTVGEESQASELAAAAPDEPGSAAVDADDHFPTEEELGPVVLGSYREHPAGVAWVFDGDAEPKAIPIGAAEARGYSIIDLSNQWTPYIFTDKTAGLDDTRPNLYREKYIGLANDRIDHYGDDLGEHEHNYLELYGIPPSLTVIQNEWTWATAEVAPCLEQAGFDPSAFTRYGGTIAYRRNGQSKRKKTARSRKAVLAKRMRKAGLDPSSPEDLASAAQDDRTRKYHKRWRDEQDVIDVIDQAQRRFRCELLFNGSGGKGKFKSGVYDSATTHALANFERKHDVKGWGHFKQDNLAVLALSPDQAVHERLLRAIQERVVMSTGVLEDGSAGQWKPDFRYKDSEGNEHALPNLVDDYTAAVVEALHFTTPAEAKKSLAALSDLGEGGFDKLLIAVKLPPQPAYYGGDMALSSHIDRGDIWYDFPYDDEGNKLSQPRGRYPHLTLYVEYEGQKIPLVHWRTTIGSWRTEMNEGELMLKYKNSDVGPRVWKNIVAAPVWIPPNTTPASELVKARWRKGKFTRDINYSEIGPGYRSAYGLVAAYHIKQVVREDGTIRAELDNGIRTHGSVDYMSILRRFSHGCHRLYNMDAVRLFSFVLRHRPYTRMGQQDVGVRRNLEVDGKTYNMKIDTRGYKYELVEPIPVRVTEGRIRGARHSPILDYVLKPTKPEEEELLGADAEVSTEATSLPQ